MKDGLKDIIGKTIENVIVGENKREPNHQVFLVFSDGTSFEFYGNFFSCASGLDKGGAAAASDYIKNLGGRITHTYPLSDQV